MGCIVPEAESRLLADADLSLHAVRRRIFSSAECRSSLTEHRWTHSSLFRQVVQLAAQQCVHLASPLGPSGQTCVHNKSAFILNIGTGTL